SRTRCASTRSRVHSLGPRHRRPSQAPRAGYGTTVPEKPCSDLGVALAPQARSGRSWRHRVEPSASEGATQGRHILSRPSGSAVAPPPPAAQPAAPAGDVGKRERTAPPALEAGPAATALRH